MCFFLVSIVSYQAEVSETDRLLVQRSLTECDVSGCELENSTLKSLCPRGLPSHEKKNNRAESFYVIQNHFFMFKWAYSE
jgi:hypothetical protein